MSKLTHAELSSLLREADDRIAELETARLRAETLFAVTQVLGKTLSLQDTFETILGQLQRVVPYDSSSVQVIQNDRLVIVGGRGFDDLQALLGVGFDLEDETNPGIRVLRSKRPHVIGDVSHHPFRSTSSGIADLDADAPQIVVSRSSATKLSRPVGAYVVRLGFSARTTSKETSLRTASLSRPGVLSSRSEAAPLSPERRP